MKRYVAVLAAALWITGCGSPSAPNESAADSPTAPTPPPPGPANANATIRDFTYSPATISISVGGQVTWSNNGPSVHTTTSDGGLWNSGSLSAPSGGGGGYGGGGGSLGGTFSRVFTQAGTYDYHCSIHPEMKGSVVVSQ